jgi:integrase
MVRGVTTADEAEYICGELKQRGLLKSFVVAGTKQSTDFVDYLLTFWDYDTSPYVKEKLRKDHSIHRNYTTTQKLSVIKYWKPFFEGRCLGDITRQDIEQFVDGIAAKELSSCRKNRILKAGTIPLRWAFSKELIEKEVTMGLTWFSEKSAERQLLSPEIVQLIFSGAVEWEDDRARLANMLAAVTGLRAGEILGLRMQDIGKECLYVQHSWNVRDGLKSTKNNKPRTVEIPFQSLIDDLLNLVGRNPHGVGMESYVFWAEKLAGKPMEERLFVKGLRGALHSIGMSHASASVYVFHAWRHFFTTYMRGKLEKKLLKDQTGHLTDVMFDHYGDHRTERDREAIRQAQLEVFGALVPN